MKITISIKAQKTFFDISKFFRKNRFKKRFLHFFDGKIFVD
jgi:hypothetical protein